MSMPISRRRLLATAATGASSALLLGACTTGNSGKGDAGGPVTLTFLSHYGDEPMKSGLSAMVAEWNKANPNIQVKQQTVTFDDLLTTLNVRQTGGRGADVLSSYALWGGQLAANGVLATPPGDVAAAIKSEYAKAAVDIVTAGDGALFGYPTEFTTYALYYNKKILADAGVTSPPSTWKELEDVANKTMKKDASGNYKVVGLSLIQDGDNQTAHPFLSLLNSAGGKFLDGKGKSAMGPEAVRAMQLESRLCKSGASTQSIKPTATFPTGGVAMAIQAGWWVGSLKAQMKSKYAPTVGVAPVPGPQAGQKGSLAYGFFMGVNAGSKHQAEAWKFLTWLNSHETADKVSGMGAFLGDNGLIPPRTADAKIIGPKLQKHDSNLVPLYDAASFALAESNTANAYEAKTALHNSLTKIQVNGADPQKTFDDLVKTINSE